jgi:predicted ATPase
MPGILQRLTLRGFKTVERFDDFQPQPISVLIGPNGAGKSNFISFFRLLSWMTTPPGNLQFHVGMQGGASAILHGGPARTREVEARLTLATELGDNEYQFRLFHAAGDTLIFAEERYRFSRSSLNTKATWKDLGAGHREAGLIEKAEGGDRTAGTILSLLRKLVVYQFHNTSTTARMRNKWHRDDARWLKEDAANLAAFLFRLRNEEERYYRRIVETLRLILPFFADFELEPEQEYLLLRWRERGSDVVFSAAQAADGMLRAMALTALLLQPERDLPHVLILDEPELGLHPYAINVIAGLIRAAATRVQVILATQSVSLIDHFVPDEIVVVEREGVTSLFRRLEEEDLREWLEEYTLSELWEKNVIGGRPSR